MTLPKFNNEFLSSIESEIPKDKYKLNLQEYSEFLEENFDSKWRTEGLNLYVMNQQLLSQGVGILNEVEKIILSMNADDNGIDSKLDELEKVFRNYLYEVTIHLDYYNFTETEKFANENLDTSKILSLSEGKIVMLWETDWREGNSIHEIEDTMHYLLKDLSIGYFEAREIMRG